MKYNVQIGYRTWKEEGFEFHSKHAGTVETETPDTYFGILDMEGKEYKSTEIRKGIIDLMVKELNGFMDALAIIVGDVMFHGMEAIEALTEVADGCYSPYEIAIAYNGDLLD